jgi:uncharacterized protein (TIGR03435 family)
MLNESTPRRAVVGKALLLMTVALGAVASPTLFGQASTTQAPAAAQAGSTDVAAPAPTFDVASIKPDKSGNASIMVRFLPGGSFTATFITIKLLIEQAYDVADFQISGGPDWIKSERFDVEAKPSDSVAAELPKLDPVQRNLEKQHMIQSLLATRCKLALHHETRDFQEYALVIAKSGLKVQPANAGDTSPNGTKGANGILGGAGRIKIGMGQMVGQAISMGRLAQILSSVLKTTILDKTGLLGTYDITLQWTPDASQPSTMGAAGAGPEAPGAAAPAEPSGPSIFTALEEQLGLKLESQKGPVDVIVIDHVEEPSQN